MIARVEVDGPETLVKNFRSELEALQDSLQSYGQLYPYTSSVLRVLLPNGHYR